MQAADGPPPKQRRAGRRAEAAAPDVGSADNVSVAASSDSMAKGGGAGTARSSISLAAGSQATRGRPLEHEFPDRMGAPSIAGSARTRRRAPSPRRPIKKMRPMSSYSAAAV